MRETINNKGGMLSLPFLSSFLVLTKFNEGFYLSDSPLRPAIYFSSIGKSSSNTILEPTTIKQWG